MNDGVESLGRVRAQGLLLLAVAFLTGALAGGAVERLITRRIDVASRPSPDDVLVANGMFVGPGDIPPFLEQLHLTGDQRARLQEIFRRAQARTDALMAQSLPRVEALMDSVRGEMRSVLTPAQRLALDSLEARAGATLRRAPLPPPPGAGWGGGAPMVGPAPVPFPAPTDSQRRPPR